MMRSITLEDGRKVTILEDSYKALADALQRKEHDVPENIRIEKNCGDGDGLGIVFPNEKQVLSYNDDYGHSVKSTHRDDWVPCKLVPVDEKDLKVGHTYFRTDKEDSSGADEIEGYCKYLGDGKYAYVNNVVDNFCSVCISECNWNYWYKVVRK